MAKKKVKTQLTAAQREKILLQPCKTKAELQRWIKYHIGLDIPDTTVSRYADTNPLDAIWTVYDLCVNKNNPKYLDELLIVASRGSGKCAKKGTKILTSNGVRSIEDIVSGMRVYTGWNWSTVKTVFDEGYKPGIQITTKSFTANTPFLYAGTPHHRLQVIKEDNSVDWVYMRDLSVDDWIYKSSCDIKVNTDDSEYNDGWLVGAVCGDSNIFINKNKANKITFCSEDFKALRFYSKLVYDKFGIKQHVSRNSKKSVNITVDSRKYIDWLNNFISGELCCDKKLKTIDHSYEFLAGFIAGLMDTDGYKDGIDLTNKELIYQIGEILNIFGVSVGIDDNRRSRRYSNFINQYAAYHSIYFNTKLPEYLMPRFGKYSDFLNHRDKVNEQFRYPYRIVEPFLDVINNKLKRSNGYLHLDNGVRVRKALPYAKTWCDSYKSEFVCGYKLEALHNFFVELDMMEQADQLNFILNGYFEQIQSITQDNYYFYDLEIDDDTHAYWSNGFISHNTLGMAIAELAVMLHDRRDVVHVGAILNQAKRCYDYQIKFMLNDKMKPVLQPAGVLEKDRILEKANMEKSVFNIGNSQTTLEILPCTLKAVNGPHVPLVVVDEIDTVSGEGHKAFADISGMLDSRGNQRALRVGISTRKSRYGLMNRQIEEAERAGRTVKYWTALEFTERCPDSRSGTRKSDFYVLQDELEVITEEDWNKKSKGKQSEYTREEFPGEKCIRCPMAALCLGDAKKQTCTSPMLKPITDPIKKTMENGPDWAISQLFNLKPSVEGIIYKEFDPKLHVKDWNQMWKILTGKKFPGECTHDMFVKMCFSSDTEVLTNNGFKLFKNLTQYDTIATLNDDGNLEYQTPTDYISYHYRGEMVNLYNEIGHNGHHLDMLITPNHNVEYLHGRNFRRDRRVNLKKIRADQVQTLKNDLYIPSTWINKGIDKPDIQSPISFMTSDQFFAFLGLWISEGSMSSIRANSKWKHNKVSVSQSKSKYASDVVNKLMCDIDWPGKLRTQIDSRFSDGYVTYWEICNKELYEYLKPYKSAALKAIPRYIIENASNRQLEILLQWLCFGDGSYMFDRSKQQPYYSTGSQQLANDVQEVCFRLGYKSSISVQDNGDKTHKNTGTEYLRRFRVNIHYKNSNQPADKNYYINNNQNTSGYSGKKQSNIRTVPYDDMVYCVTMPSSRLFVRRSGVISLSGNCHQMGLASYAGIDWGWSNPSTVVYFFVDNRENVYVVRADGMTYTHNPNWIQTLKNKYQQQYRCQLYFPDLANPGDAVLMKEAGLPCATKVDKSVESGIQTVKKWLKSMASPMPKIFFAAETCGKIIDEFSLYHFKIDAAGKITDVPEKEFDHWLDALRYAMYELFGQSSMMTCPDTLDFDNVPTDPKGAYMRTPTPAEYAKANGINFNENSPEEAFNIGKVGKLSELEDDDDDNSNGGFLWSF